MSSHILNTMDSKFLTNHRQRVQVLDLISDWLPIKASVPQGAKVNEYCFKHGSTIWISIHPKPKSGIMSTMNLCPNSLKETIIKASNQVLIPSSLRAIVVGWNSMPTISVLWLPKLLKISTCSMYWAEKASRLKTQLQFIYPWYDLQLQIVVQYGTTLLPLTTLKR